MKADRVKTEDPGQYITGGQAGGKDAEDAIIAQALQILERRLMGVNSRGKPLTSPQATRDYLRLQLAENEREHFGVMFLDTRHRLIKYEELFFGTVDSAHVHPREVVKDALACNSAAVIVVHNHPSGVAEPSQADLAITRRLRDGLGLVDIRLLDHFIVGSSEVVSLAERGLV